MYVCLCVLRVRWGRFEAVPQSPQEYLTIITRCSPLRAFSSGHLCRAADAHRRTGIVHHRIEEHRSGRAVRRATLRIESRMGVLADSVSAIARVGQTAVFGRPRFGTGSGRAGWIFLHVLGRAGSERGAGAIYSAMVAYVVSAAAAGRLPTDCRPALWFATRKTI